MTSQAEQHKVAIEFSAFGKAWRLSSSKTLPSLKRCMFVSVKTEVLLHIFMLPTDSEIVFVLPDTSWCYAVKELKASTRGGTYVYIQKVLV